MSSASTNDRWGSEPLDSNDTRSFASSQRNGHFSTLGTTLSSAASSGRSGFLEDTIPTHKGDVMRIQSQVKTFTKSMVRGKEMSFLSADGEIRNCTCSFDRRLQKYNLLINKEMRSFPLVNIKEVFRGVEPGSIPTPLEELCATIMLDTGECLSFRFADVRECETFSLYLQIIVDGNP